MVKKRRYYHEINLGGFEKLINKFYKNNVYIKYTCTFLLLLPVVFLPFLLEAKTFIWTPDGIDQHYPALMYYGKLLRGILSGRGFPMMDFKLGLGFDTIATLQYYVLGDPLTLISVFMTPHNSVFIYCFLVLIRLYLAGISFILLMKYFEKDGVSILLGAMIYAFSGYSLYAGPRHPFFMNPMIYLPLIIIGVEQVFRNKKPYVLIAMVFISTISNFYFFYDLTIITVIYVIFRYFTVYRKNYKNAFLGLLLTGLKTGGYYLLGTALASFLFIPVIYAFTQNGRLTTSPLMAYGYLYYSGKYYLSLFQSLYTGGSNPGNWTIATFSSVVIVSFAIFIGNKKYKQLQWIYLLTFLGLFIPAFGYFMNGFSYTANRWSFMLSLLVAVTFTFTYDELFNLRKKERKILLIETVLCGILAFVFPSKLVVKVSFFALLIVLLCIFILQTNYMRDKKRLSNIIIYALVFLSLGFNGYGLYSRQFHDYTDQFLSKEEVIKQSSKGILALIPQIKDKSFYRVETYGDKALNESMTVGYHDVSGYFSLIDGNITSYMMGLEVLNQKTAIRFDNLDNRTDLDELAGVKYFVTTDKSMAPFGYHLIKELNSTSTKGYLFENSYALPLGYTYEKYMLKSDYDKLSAVDKQNAMLYSVILNQNMENTKKSVVNESYSVENLNVRILPSQNVSLNNNKIDVKEAGATITLEFDTKPNAETYVRIGNLNTNNKLIDTINFYVKGRQGIDKNVNVRSPYKNSYFGKENYLVNLGYSENGENQAVITFPEACTLNYGSIEVYSVDMSNYANQVQALIKSSLSNIKRFNNYIQGDITLDKKEIMVLSIPYGKGWSAYVDGEKSEILKANVMYMAIPLEAGNHHILMKYQTPYLKLGCFVSFLALLILIGVIFFYKQKRVTS